MISNKNKPDFEYSFRVVFNDEEIDSSIIRILEDYGCELVDDTTDSLYFK